MGRDILYEIGRKSAALPDDKKSLFYLQILSIAIIQKGNAASTKGTFGIRIDTLSSIDTFFLHI